MIGAHDDTHDVLPAPRPDTLSVGALGIETRLVTQNPATMTPMRARFDNYDPAQLTSIESKKVPFSPLLVLDFNFSHGDSE